MATYQIVKSLQNNWVLCQSNLDKDDTILINTITKKRVQAVQISLLGWDLGLCVARDERQEALEVFEFSKESLAAIGIGNEILDPVINGHWEVTAIWGEALLAIV
jgi:hypothetical protein